MSEKKRLHFHHYHHRFSRSHSSAATPPTNVPFIVIHHHFDDDNNDQILEDIRHNFKVEAFTKHEISILNKSFNSMKKNRDNLAQDCHKK